MCGEPARQKPENRRVLLIEKQWHSTYIEGTYPVRGGQGCKQEIRRAGIVSLSGLGLAFGRAWNCWRISANSATTPFMLLAAWLFSKGSPRLHAWDLQSSAFWSVDPALERTWRDPSPGQDHGDVGLCCGDCRIPDLCRKPLGVMIQLLVAIPVSCFILSRPSRLPASMPMAQVQTQGGEPGAGS